MAIHKSVLKRERQQVIARMRNRVRKSKVHTAKIKLDQAVFAKDKEAAHESLSLYMSEVDKTVKKGIFHRNKGNRLKSRATIKIKKAFDEFAAK